MPPAGAAERHHDGALHVPQGIRLLPGQRGPLHLWLYHRVLHPYCHRLPGLCCYQGIKIFKEWSDLSTTMFVFITMPNLISLHVLF